MSELNKDIVRIAVNKQWQTHKNQFIHKINNNLAVIAAFLNTLDSNDLSHDNGILLDGAKRSYKKILDLISLEEADIKSHV